MDILAGPAIEQRAERTSLGIREIVPFRGMLSARDRLWAELLHWLEVRRNPDTGALFLRLHVIDMRGEMDIEAGMITDGEVAGDDRVRPGRIPAGEYATLSYKNHSIRANGLLIDWTAAQGRAFDQEDDPAGDRFASRCEINITDPRREKRRKEWIVQLDFLLRSEQQPTLRGASHG